MKRGSMKKISYAELCNISAFLPLLRKYTFYYRQFQLIEQTLILCRHKHKKGLSMLAQYCKPHTLVSPLWSTHYHINDFSTIKSLLFKFNLYIICRNNFFFLLVCKYEFNVKFNIIKNANIIFSSDNIR